MSKPEQAPAAATRSIVVEREIAAPPEDVWTALTTPEGLRQWFPLDARVEPGEGGSIWLSWGPGAAGEAPIHAWAPPRHLGWTEAYGEDEAGRPIEVAVDFYVEDREGTTVVRLVQSGFSASEEWDEMYDALVDGWTYFLFNLAFYFLKHRNRNRKLVWRRVATDLARDVVWESLVAGAVISGVAERGAQVELSLDEVRSAEVVSARKDYHFAATVPGLDDSVLFVELEGKHVGLWLSTYDAEEDRVEQLERALDDRVAATLGAGLSATGSAPDGDAAS